MNLISCKQCGVVLDKDQLEFPDIEDDNGDYIDGLWMWDHDLGFFSKLPCPVCKGDIPEKE